VVLSEKVPVAANSWLVPAAMLGIGGVSAIEAKVAGVTVIVISDATEPHALGTEQTTLMVAVPGPTAVILPPLLTVATSAFEVVQFRSSVTSEWLLSERIAVAASCVEVPFAKLGLVGVS